MKKLQAIMALTMLLSVSTSASQPEITVSTDAVESLPKAAQQALQKWNFKFKAFKETDFTPEVLDLFKEDKEDRPMKLVGDFNGDGTADFAVLGEAGKQQYAVALLSDKKAFKAVVVNEWSYDKFKQTSVPGAKATRTGVPVYLARAEGELADKFKAEKKRDVIQIEAYLGAVELFKIENGKAVQLKL